MEADWNEWRTNAIANEGDDYAVGSVAVLANPQPVDTGLYSTGRTVSRFVKREAGGGRWVSYPGSDIYFNTLGDLELALTESGNAILEVVVPEIGDDEDAAEVIADDAAQAARDALAPVYEANQVQEANQARGGIPWKWLGIGAAALWLLGGRR